MCAPLLARLNPPTQADLSKSGFYVKDLANIKIVGGDSFFGYVNSTLSKILGIDDSYNNGLSTTLNAYGSVARGAALQSAILSPRFKVLLYEIVDFQPYHVKIPWFGDGVQEGVIEVE